MASGPVSLAHSAENREYLFRLQMLIIDGALLVLREIFDTSLTSKGITLNDLLKWEKPTIRILKNRNHITEAQYELLYPSGNQVPTTSDMDLTLIICILRNIKFFGLKNFNWNETPSPEDFSTEADICRLKNFRNKISHISTTTGIDFNEFKSSWETIEKTLMRLSSPALNIKQTIADFKICPLYPKEEHRIQQEIKKWKDIVEVEVDHLQEELKVLETKFNTLKKKGEFDKPGNYETQRNELKLCLIEFYKQRHSKVFLSPLFDEEDTLLASFYLKPELKSFEQEKTKESKKPTLKSLSELFSDKHKDHQQIYLIADPGLGKTVFSKYLAILWCQAHYPDEKSNKYFEKQDFDCMHDFDFLFLVSLRDSYNLCYIDELISKKIVLNTDFSGKFQEDYLCEIFKKEKCLIILDGLDEWMHPDKECYQERQSSPHMKVREKCTILTTTRRWKLRELNFKSSEFGLKVELTELSQVCAETLTARVLQKLKPDLNKETLQSEVQHFIEEIEKTDNNKLVRVPLFLIYAICLWCDGIQIRTLKCDFYLNILEFLLARTIKKHRKFQSCPGTSASKIPECFSKYDHCKKHFALLMALGELAFYTLVNETLVFDRSVADKYITSEDLSISLLLGVLTENTYRKLTTQLSEISFYHKIFHELFAAIFISFQRDIKTTVFEKCKSIKDFLVISASFEFVSKMNPDLICEILGNLISVVNKDDKTREYMTGIRLKRTNHMECVESLKSIQKMFLTCLKGLEEILDRKSVRLGLQFIFLDGDGEDSELLKQFCKRNKSNFKSLDIDISNTSKSLGEIYHLFAFEGLEYVRSVYFKGKLNELELNNIMFPSLLNLTLMDGRLTNKKLNEKLFKKLQNLSCLRIENFMFSHKILETFLNFVQDCISLKELTIENVACIDHSPKECSGLTLNVPLQSSMEHLLLRSMPPLKIRVTTTSLVDFELLKIKVDEDSLLLTPDMLNVNKICLGKTEMSSRSLQKVFAVLENLPQEIVITVKDKDLKPIIKTLQNDKKVHVSDAEHGAEFDIYIKAKKTTDK